ncbi:MULTISPECIES: hypothetical protein [Nostocales]|uniref:Transposase n=1 Tax=Scytonema tolypothrichoides VB-61278_2 TaxID=3232314 RepID=A0ABW8WYN0_9CYAN
MLIFQRITIRILTSSQLPHNYRLTFKLEREIVAIYTRLSTVKKKVGNEDAASEKAFLV